MEDRQATVERACCCDSAGWSREGNLMSSNVLVWSLQGCWYDCPWVGYMLDVVPAPVQ
jgi:hypothetical protein